MQKITSWNQLEQTGTSINYLINWVNISII